MVIWIDKDMYLELTIDEYLEPLVHSNQEEYQNNAYKLQTHFRVPWKISHELHDFCKETFVEI